MPQVEDIKVLKIDNVPVAVDTLSAQVQSLVSIFNEWNQDLADAQTKQNQLAAAVKSLSNQIVETIRVENEEAKKDEESKSDSELKDIDAIPDVDGSTIEPDTE